MSNTDPCPGCGAEYRPYSLDGPYDCGTVIIAGQVIWGKECLRRQLAQAQERERVLRDLLTVHERQQVDALAREARLRRLLDDVEWVRMLNDDGDVFEMCLFCDSIKECGHEDWCTRQTDLAAAPANPYAAVVEAARALAVTLYQHNEAAIKRFHIEVLGREGEIDDDEGDCCEICCEVSDLLYDLGQNLGEIGIDDLSKMPDIRDLAKLPPEGRAEAIRRLNDGAGIADALADLGREEGGE